MKPLRLRQIALVAADLAKARADIEAVLGVDYAYADKGVEKYGLENWVFPIGDTFLEVVSPKAPGTTAGRLLEKRAGDGGYMVILQAEDLVEARSRILEAGARIVDQFDGEGVAFTHIHPRDVGGAILSIDRMEPPSRWAWGGPGWEDHVKTDVAVQIVGAELQGEDPAAMAARWAGVLGRPAERSGTQWRIGLDGGELRFASVADGRGEGLGTFDVVVRDPEAVRGRAKPLGLLTAEGVVVLSGTRVRLLAEEARA
jgi:hypothetical protein